MINVANYFFDRLSTYMYEKMGEDNISLSTDIVMDDARFPHITFIEESNIAYEQTADTASTENDAELMYQVDVYSKSTIDSGRKSEAYKIASLVDTKMAEMGFTRVSMTPIIDETFYRLSIRYRIIVSKDNLVYRR